MVGEHIILRGVKNSRKLHPLPETHRGRTISAVWLLLDEGHFLRNGDAQHHVNAFLDDRMHDWEQRGNELRYYAHSSAMGDVVDVIIFFAPVKTLMRVKGVEIPQTVQDEALAFMKTEHSLTLFKVQGLIERLMGLKHSDEVAMRAADRIMQRERKAGNIGPSDNTRSRSHYWKWIGQ